MPAVGHLGFVTRMFGLRRAFGGLYHCGKFSWNRRGSFDNMPVLIFCASGLKTPIHAPKIGGLGTK